MATTQMRIQRSVVRIFIFQRVDSTFAQICRSLHKTSRASLSEIPVSAYEAVPLPQ